MGLVPARVTVQQRELWHVLALSGASYEAKLTGKFRFEAETGDYPVAGDWVAIEPLGLQARIHHVLPRTGTLVRKAAGTGQIAQTIAANVDIGLLVSALNEDFSPRRIERYIALCQGGRIEPVIVLTKADLVADYEPYLTQLDDVARKVPIIIVSAISGEGLKALSCWLVKGQTAALLGSSGAGKSTLVNALAGNYHMPTATIRQSDGTGRHTTTHRELVILPDGALILDSPGMRELALWDGAEGVSTAFADVESLASACQFSDCQHVKEPACAVRAALEAGDLDPHRWASFQKLQRELVYEKAKGDPILRAENKKIWKRRNADYIATMRLRNRSND